MKRLAPTLYLFNNVFFPETVIPLTVSDDTSKDVLYQCFEKKKPIALFHPGDHSRGIGTWGRIILLEYNPDGSLTVMVQGISRVKFAKEVQTIPFPIFEFEDLEDTEDPSVILDDSIERLYTVLENWINRHIPSNKERSAFMKEMKTPSKLINNLCLLVIKDVELKEIFLHSTSLPERIRMMDALLRKMDAEIEDITMCEALKKFENLTPNESFVKSAV
jgi:Lon protease-like protein